MERILTFKKTALISSFKNRKNGKKPLNKAIIPTSLLGIVFGFIDQFRKYFLIKWKENGKNKSNN